MASPLNTAVSVRGSPRAFSPTTSLDLVAAQYQCGIDAEYRRRPAVHHASSYSHPPMSKPLSTSALTPPYLPPCSPRHIRSASAEPAISRPYDAQIKFHARSDVQNLVIPPAPDHNRASEGKLTRRSWLPGSSKPKATNQDQAGPRAWIAGHTGQTPYNIELLITGQPVAELWDESGDTFVYLFPPALCVGPSFRLQSSSYASSMRLTQLAHGGNRRAASAEVAQERFQRPAPQDSHHSIPRRPPMTRRENTADSSSTGSSKNTRGSPDPVDEPSRQFHLRLPVPLTIQGAFSPSKLTHEDVDALIAVRNMFAFLVGQSLVATEKRSTVFDVFLNVSRFLEYYDFTNIDGSTFGEVVATSLDSYVLELGISDVRSSREKTIEALVLGEKLRSATLYNEAFTHAVGKYKDIQKFAKLPEAGIKFNMLSSITQSRLERAYIDLAQREKAIQSRLLDFDFPSVFAGVMSSKMASERKHIRFDAWKTAFSSTRRHVLAYYKQAFGSWPPKANSKKNGLETGGLNRLVLRALYRDFGHLYNLLVDRTSITTRSMGSMYLLPQDGETVDGIEELVPRIIRRVCDEYDRSYPPVQPPIPFDTPLLPKIPNHPHTPSLLNKKLKGDEIHRILNTASNFETAAGGTANSSPFVAYMRDFERHQVHGGTLADLVDFRAGLWIFLYVVLQALPMLTVDAPGLHWHQGVEYFLCQPPRGGPPWVKCIGSDGISSRRRAMNWYGVSGGQGVVNLPADLVEHGVEGVYHRSHCWLMAAKWSASPSFCPSDPSAGTQKWDGGTRDSLDKPLPPPPLFAGGIRSTPPGASTASYAQPRSRDASPAALEQRLGQHSSTIGLGLEHLPLPPGVTPEMQGPGARPKRMCTPVIQTSLTPAISSSSDQTSASPRSSSGGASSSHRLSPGRGRDVRNSPATQCTGSARSSSSGKTFDDILSSMSQADAAARKDTGFRKSSR